MNLGEWIAQHRKILTYIAGIVVYALTQQFGADSVWVQVAILAATGAGIYQFRNIPPGDTNGQASSTDPKRSSHRHLRGG